MLNVLSMVLDQMMLAEWADGAGGDGAAAAGTAAAAAAASRAGGAAGSRLGTMLRVLGIRVGLPGAGGPHRDRGGAGGGGGGRMSADLSAAPGQTRPNPAAPGHRTSSGESDPSLDPQTRDSSGAPPGPTRPSDPRLFELSVEKTNKIEVLYVVASLLGGPCRSEVQRRLVDCGVVQAVSEILSQLSWEPGCDGDDGQPGIHGAGCSCGSAYSAFKGQLLREYTSCF